MGTGTGVQPPQLGLPPEVEAVFHQFRTAEMSTIARDGTPVTVEVTPVWQPDRGRFLVTASIGLPRKAYNARRNPQVALLYSDPTASALPQPPAVLVQGQATVSELVTCDDELASYWLVLWTKQPIGRRWGGPGHSPTYGLVLHAPQDSYRPDAYPVVARG